MGASIPAAVVFSVCRKFILLYVLYWLDSELQCGVYNFSSNRLYIQLCLTHTHKHRCTFSVSCFLSWTS